MRNALYLLSIVIFISCNTKHSNEKTIGHKEPQNETPEVFEQTKIETELKSFGKRYSENVIEQLFNEAKEKDTDLENLMNDISQIKVSTIDSQEAYNIYKNNNDLRGNNLEN